MFELNTKNAKFDDNMYLVYVLIRQLAHFGSVPESYADRISMEDVESWTNWANANQWIKDNRKAT